MSNANLVQFWVWCLLKATHKHKKIMVGFQEIALDPGQFVFGRHAAAKELKSSERSVRTCLTTLKSTSNLTIKTTNKFSIISVTNWDTYQNQQNTNDQQTAIKTTNERPATDQQLTTNKNVKTQQEVTTLPGIPPGDDPVVKKQKPKKPTDPELKEAIEHFCSKYESVIGAPYAFCGGKDAATLQRLKRTFTLQQLKDIIDLFFESDDPFITNAGHTVGVLSSKAQWLVEKEMTK